MTERTESKLTLIGVFLYKYIAQRNRLLLPRLVSLLAGYVKDRIDHLWLTDDQYKRRNIMSQSIEYPQADLLSTGSLSKDVFDRRTSSGNEAFSILICLDATKCINYVSLLLCRWLAWTWFEHNNRSWLRRSKTSLLTSQITAHFKLHWRGQSCNSSSSFSRG